LTPGALACGEEAEPARRELARLRQAAVMAFREWFEWGVREGDLLGGTDCATLARYIATVLNGLAVQAASGATEKELRQVAAVAMRAWPA
jgi:hypothetical protein